MANAAREGLGFPEMAMTLSVTFWGTRGTIPVPGARSTRYGGNTACVSIQDAEGRCVIFDAGTGIRGLGRSLRGVPSSGRLDLFLSHVHWDHIQGLPFFSPLFTAGQEIRIHGPTPDGIRLETVLERQLEPAVYPVPRAHRPARLTVTELQAGASVDIPGFRVESCPLSHPGGALGYRVAPIGGGPAVAYLTDNELGAGGAARVSPRWLDELTAFVGGAALLIHDAMYTPGLGRERAGWGHSTASEAVTLAARAGVKHLVLFHHDPDHDDEHVDALLADARAAAPADLAVSAAREGWVVSL